MSTVYQITHPGSKPNAVHTFLMFSGSHPSYIMYNLVIVLAMLTYHIYI